MGDKKNFLRKRGGITLYDDADGVWSLRKYYGWTQSFIQIRRSSDNDRCNVFFNGALSYDTIDLNSYISDTLSNTTPDAITLGTWIGSDDGFVYSWFGQFVDDVHRGSDYQLTNSTSTAQPKIISAGVILTKNGLPCMTLDGTDSLDESLPLASMNDGNSFTMLFVASNDSTTADYYLLTNRTGATFNGLLNIMASGVSKTISQLVTTVTTYSTNYISQETTTNQRLLSTVVTPSNMESFYNGTSQESLAVSGSWANFAFRLARDRTASSFYLIGSVQEVILFPSDKTADLAALHSELNSYYSIY